MTQVVLAADIREESPTRKLALSTYNAFKKAGVDVHFVYIGDQRKDLEEMGLPYLHVNEIEYSIIIALREIRAFTNIDRTNTLVYLATTDEIEDFMTFMIHRVDHVITPDYRTAFQMVSNLKQLGLETPVHRIQPWLDASLVKRTEVEELKILAYGPEAMIQSIYGENITYWGYTDIDGWEMTDDPNFEDYSVYVHVGLENSLQIREAMMAGLIPIAINALPNTEFIIDRVNGFLVTTSDDLVSAISDLKDESTRNFFRMTALKTAIESMSQESWAGYFLKTVQSVGAENLNVDGQFKEMEPHLRRWLVPKTVLRGGKKMNIPRQYNQNRFKVVELNSLKEILQYFSLQKFRDVFIFGWEYDDVSERDRILNLVRVIGRRGLNMHFCTDEEIPEEWQDVFRHMTVLPVQEGLKKVKPLPGPNIPIAQ